MSTDTKLRVFIVGPPRTGRRPRSLRVIEVQRRITLQDNVVDLNVEIWDCSQSTIEALPALLSREPVHAMMGVVNADSAGEASGSTEKVMEKIYAMFEGHLQQPSNQVSILAHQPPNTIREQTRSSKFRFARSIARHNIQNTSLEDPDLIYAEFERILVGAYKTLKESTEAEKVQARPKDAKSWWTED